MKKIFASMIILSVILFCFSLTSCNSADNDSGADDINGGGGILPFGKSLQASDLSILDFVWETIPSKYNGVDCYTFSLINNSAYDVLGVEFTYKVRSDVVDSDLVVYDEFLKEHEGYIEVTDSPRNVILRGSKDALVPKGEQLTGLRFTVGYKNWAWYDYPTDEQFELMEPKELEIGVIGENNTFYIAYYSFEDKAWTLDENTVPANTWSKKEIAEHLSKPNEKHHIVVKDEDDGFAICSYGVTKDDYIQYVDSIKNLGYEEEGFSSAFFKGKSRDGYSVELWYYSDEERLSVSINKDV